MRYTRKSGLRKKPIKRLAEIVKEGTADKDYQIIIIHGNALDKAETLRDILHQDGFAGEIPFATFGSVIGTHLGNHSVAISFVPKYKEKTCQLK